MFIIIACCKVMLFSVLILAADKVAVRIWILAVFVQSEDNWIIVVSKLV